MNESYVYRPRSNWVYLGIILLIGALATFGFASAGRSAEAIASVLNFLAFGLIFWVFVVSPKVVYTAESIEIHNPLKTIVIGWHSAKDFTTRYSFTVITAKEKISAWGAPAPSRFNARKIHNSDFRGTGLETRKVISPNDSPRAESGVALILALRYKDKAVADGTAVDKLTRKINWLSLAQIGVSIVLLATNFLN